MMGWDDGMMSRWWHPSRGWWPTFETVSLASATWTVASWPTGSPFRSRALARRAAGRPDSGAEESHSKSALQVVKVVMVMKPCSQPLAASRTCEREHARQ